MIAVLQHISAKTYAHFYINNAFFKSSEIANTYHADLQFITYL